MKQPFDPDPLYVPEQPVRRACAGCGRVLVHGSRCDDCLGRGGSALGWLVLAFLVAVIATVAIFAASRPGSVALTQPARTEAPRAPVSDASHAPAPVLEAGSEGPKSGLTTPMSARYAGTASWYCGNGSPCTRGTSPDDMVAAIDTDLGFRKGDRVVVRYRDRAVTVRIVDVCGCPGERLIDLTTGAFRRLAPLGLGVLPVTLESAEGIRLPETDEEGES